VGGRRHRRVAAQAIEESAGLPVVGALPRRPAGTIPSRHLGLLTPQEHAWADEAIEQVGRLVADSVDLDAIIRVARTAPHRRDVGLERRVARDGRGVRIGVLKDSAFTFYYPDNIEALEARGAEIVFVSPLRDERLPAVDALYVGGGFPETHAEALASNVALLSAIRKRAAAGMPVYAECGGLMYMSRTLSMGDRTFQMVGALPLQVVMQERPVGHGYVEAEVVGETPFYSSRQVVLGHEFHYSRVVGGLDGVSRVFRMKRGAGVDEAGGEGMSLGRVLGTYVHVHAAGADAWAEGMMRAAREASSHAPSE